MMKRFLVLIAVMLLGSSLAVTARSSKTVRELFKDIILQSIPYDEDGHVPYQAKATLPMSWQSGIGLKKVLVILLDFPDEIHQVKHGLFSDVMRSEKRMSLKRYYETITDGRLKIDFGKNDIPDWHRLPKSYIDYIVDNDIDFEKVVNSITADGLESVEKRGIDLAEYDGDDNGIPDITVFFLAGNSLSVGGYMLGDFTMTTSERTIVMVAEDYWQGEYNSPTLIHEMAHAMVPIWDLYDYTYSSEPIGNWDIMGSGSWVGNCGMCGFTRWKAGWTDLKWLDKPGEYEIDDINSQGENKLFGIKIPGSDGEWLLLENRQATGVEAFFNGPPAKGVAVYLVDDKRPYDHRFNTLSKTDKTHGIFFLKLLASSSSLTPDTSPGTLPYQKLDRATPNIGIRNVSKPDEKMTFTLSYDRPKLPVVSVSSKIFLGKIVINTTKSFEIPFVNIGIGTLHIVANSRQKWLTLDRTSFIGNEETINCSIDTKGMKRGKASAEIIYSNKSSEAGGGIIIEFEVTPIHGDIDANDKVDEEDFKAFLKLYGLDGENPSFRPDYDFNSDGRIDLDDLILLAKNYK